jgi:hypothetical protein
MTGEIIRNLEGVLDTLKRLHGPQKATDCNAEPCMII